jgi:hypothetical protein
MVSPFARGRLLIVMCAVAVSSLLPFILRRLTGAWRIGASFGFLLLTLPAFRFWLYLLRADVIGVVFSMIGMALYLLGKKYWCWSIPFFGLALFCKYSLLAAPVAVFIHLLMIRQMRQLGVFMVGLGTASATAFTVLQIKTSGWYAFHMFSTHPDRYSLLQFLALGSVGSGQCTGRNRTCGLVCRAGLPWKGFQFPADLLGGSERLSTYGG